MEYSRDPYVPEWPASYPLGPREGEELDHESFSELIKLFDTFAKTSRGEIRQDDLRIGVIATDSHNATATGLISGIDFNIDLDEVTREEIVDIHHNENLRRQLGRNALLFSGDMYEITGRSRITKHTPHDPFAPTVAIEQISVMTNRTVSGKPRWRPWISQIRSVFEPHTSNVRSIIHGLDHTSQTLTARYHDALPDQAKYVTLNHHKLSINLGKPDVLNLAKLALTHRLPFVGPEKA